MRRRPDRFVVGWLSQRDTVEDAVRAFARIEYGFQGDPVVVDERIVRPNKHRFLVRLGTQVHTIDLIGEWDTEVRQ